MEIAILALGCFWGPEIKFSKLEGIIKTEVGYFLSPDLLAYFALFDWDTNHPVMKRLLKKIYQHIQEQ